MKIRVANERDLELLIKYDKHIAENELKSLIHRERVLIAEENGDFCGWLRYNLFWDNTPFLNMLFVRDEYRAQGIGQALTLDWEKRMKMLQHELLMTSTLANEQAQHFYRKLGYRDAGSLLLPSEPLEIIFIKEI